MVDIGSVLGSRFCLVRHIADGYSELSTAVFEAEDATNGQRVAVKIARQRDGRSEYFIQHEVRVLRRVSHPNVVTLFATSEPDEECPYFVMELFADDSLRQCLWKMKFSIREALRVSQEICAGLAAAHKAGVIHADLCPRGVFTTKASRDGRQVKLIDFGLSLVDGLPPIRERPGIVWGKLRYLSPEQIAQEQIDERSDLYNVGLILFEMLVGTMALPQDYDELCTNTPRSRLDPRPPLEAIGNAPRALIELITQLLAFNRNNRPASAQEVEQALARIERELPS